MHDDRHRLKSAISNMALGDEAAMAVLYDQTNQILFGTIVRIVRARSRAEDVLQDVYLKVWRRAGTYDPEKCSPITWLCAIARNAAIDCIRREGKGTEIGDDALGSIADGGQAADDWLCDLEDHEALKKCMESLTKDHHQTIRLAYFEGLTHSELAGRVGAPMGTVKSWLNRGLAGLRRCLNG